MRDPAEIRTKKGTSLVVIVTRALFVAYFVVSALATHYKIFPGSELDISWLVYLIILYLIAERFFAVFMDQGIDLSFAFPLLFSIYMLNFVSLLLRAQEHFPIINRAEHFTSFILIGYVVWIFFLKYLPQDVWSEHPYYTALLVLAVTSLMGSINEIIELFLDGIFKTEFVGERTDTSLDLLMNTLGTGLFLAVRLILGTTEKKPKIQ